MHDDSLEKLVDTLNINIRSNPRGTDKLWPHGYINGFYDNEFKKYKSQHCRLLEIGFRHGASLYLWAHYFPDAEIYGFDNGSDISISSTSPVNKTWISHPKIKTKFGDAYSDDFAEAVQEKFDIIIDDGPHTLVSQIKFLKLYLNKLSVNGIAIIEDLQKYGGLLLWPLMINTPLKYHIEFHDFRKKTRVGDDLLFVVKNFDQPQFQNRIKIFLIAISYLATEPFVLMGKLVRKGFKK